MGPERPPQSRDPSRATLFRRSDRISGGYGMSGESAIDVLRTEHRAILRMLDVTRELAHLMEAGAEVPPDMLDSVAEFLRVFGDAHLRKEEEYLFPALGKRGLSLDGMAIESLQRDHDHSRTLLGKMSDAAVAYREHRPKADQN